MINEKAYAKINLILNVLNKREDGFHNVDFLMTSLELHDDVRLEYHKTDYIIVKNNPRLSNNYNLAFKALKLMKKKYKIKNNFLITITKRIPVAAGMAGGSSDAAAVIRAINEMENLNLSLVELEGVAKELGSDVPFCLYSTLARATNKGEKITLIDQKLEHFDIVAVNPGVRLSTPKVFKHHKIETEHQDVEALIADLSYDNLQRCMFNNLENTAMKICYDIVKLKKELQKYTDKKIMVSGSGPTVFIVFNKTDEAKKVYESIKDKYPKSYITKLR